MTSPLRSPEIHRTPLFRARLGHVTLPAYEGGRAGVGDERWFYRDEHDWAALVERLKLTACPHCRVVGTLIRHGSLYGFDDAHPPRQTVRARRVYCSNRHRRSGCGRTVSVWLADKIRRLSLSTRSLWGFLRLAVAGSIAAAIRAIGSGRSDRTWQRLWNRFDCAQAALRTTLFRRGPPPESTSTPSRRPDAAQLLAHLSAAFPHADCPIAAYQQATRTFFL